MAESASRGIGSSIFMARRWYESAPGGATSAVCFALPHRVDVCAAPSGGLGGGVSSWIGCFGSGRESLGGVHHNKKVPKNRRKKWQK